MILTINQKMMKNLTLIRTQTGDQGTAGRLLDESGRHLCFTLEPPWRDNQPDISCIPAGSYPVLEHYSQKFGHVLMLQNVPGRTYIYIHAGNVAGDRSQGLSSHSYGCILTGRRRGSLYGQLAVLASRVARVLLEQYLGWQPSNIIIKEAYS